MYITNSLVTNQSVAMAFIYSPKHISVLRELELSAMAHQKLLEKFKQSSFYAFEQKGLGLFLVDLMPGKEHIIKAVLFNRRIHIKVNLKDMHIARLDSYLAQIRHKLEKYTD